MAEDSTVTVYNSNAITDTKKNPFSIKVEMAQMLRGDVILEVTAIKQAKHAKDARACVIVVSKPESHCHGGGILQMPEPFQIDESEALALANEQNFINKHNFQAPFICGCYNLGEALRRVKEGAAMVRTQGKLSSSENVTRTVQSVRSVMGEISVLNNMDEDEVFAFSKKISTPYNLVAHSKPSLFYCAMVQL